jgi:uncharacterized RDD family membrane protein YckC
MTPNEGMPFIGRVRGGSRAPRRFVDTPAAAQPTPLELEPPPMPVEPAPTGSGIAPRQPDIGSVAYWRRIVAFVLDALVIFWLQFALTVLGVLFYIDSSTDTVNGVTVRHVAHRGPMPWGDDFAPLITFIVLAFIYEVAFISIRGQTPAKERLKIRVTRVADGKNPTVKQAMLRSSVVAVFRLVPGGLMLMGNLAAFATGVTAPFNMRRRGLHDYLAGTMVVRYDADFHEGHITLAKRPGLFLNMRIGEVTGRAEDLRP